jgi:hypothetical protein
MYSISVYLYLHNRWRSYDIKTGNSDNQGESQNNHDIEGPDDDSMDLIRARQLFNSEKNPRIEKCGFSHKRKLLINQNHV